MRTIVHEMRNHLAIAVANVEAFLDGKLEPSQARLRSVLQILNELDLLMDDLTVGASAQQNAPSRQASSAMRTIDVCALIANEALAAEAKAREKGVRYEISTCDEPHVACTHFLGDPVRVSEIVQNVLLNAIRYTPPGGIVRVDCRRACGDLVFSVHDTGCGIETSELETIFEPGVRGAASAGKPGSGMGLAVVKRFVQEHGGTILVESEAERGATFRISLPGRMMEQEDDPRLPRVL